MKKINWESGGSGTKGVAVDYVYAWIGHIKLRCFLYLTSNSRQRWCTDASFNEISMTVRRGPMRHSLAKAKNDAVRLARELLLDHHASLTIEMKNFDLLE